MPALKRLAYAGAMGAYAGLTVPVWLAGRARHALARRAGRLAAGEHRVVPAVEVGGVDLSALVDAQQAVVIKGLTRGWDCFPALQPEALRRQFGDQSLNVFVNPSERRGFLQETAQSRCMNYADFIDRVFFSPSPDARYYSRFGVPSPLMIPDILSLGIRRHLDHCMVWIGSAGNITPLHCDPWQGFLGQAVGRKRAFLFPPGTLFNLYHKSFFCRDYNARSPTLLPDDFRDADLQEFPLLASATRWEAVLEPGDALFIPSCWWHQVHSLDDSVSVLFRYRHRRRELLRHPEALCLRWGNLRNYLQV